MSTRRMNLGARIIGAEARAKQVKEGKRARARLGKRILGLQEEVATATDPSQASKSVETHTTPEAGATVKDARAQIMAEGSDLVGIEMAERARKDGPRKGVLAALEEEHERRRTSDPDAYQAEPGAEGEDGAGEDDGE